MIIVLVVFLFYKRYRGSSKISNGKCAHFPPPPLLILWLLLADPLTAHMLAPQTSISDGIPNASYDPMSMGVVYAAANGDHNFDNPLYQSAAFTYTPTDTSPNAGGEEEGANTMSSSGLYSTIDNRSPTRSWALRPSQSGQ